MSRPDQPSTLRDVQAHLGKRTVQITLVSVAIVLALLGPFDTANVIPLLPCVAYWGLVVVSTYAVGACVTWTIRNRFGNWPIFLRAVSTGLGIAAAVNIIVFGLNIAIWPDVFLPLTQQLPLAASISGICVVVGCAFVALELTETPSPETPEGAVPLLDRLPLEKRGALVALSVEDHYVRVRTTKGEHLLLMRLSDAIRETQPESGLQVHRSHWISANQVTSAQRDGSRYLLQMSHGDTIPVSRSNLQQARDAGVLPKRR